MIRTIVRIVTRAYKILLGWFIVLLLFPFLGLLCIYKQSVVFVARFKGLVVTETSVGYITTDKVAYNDQVEHEYKRKPIYNIGMYVDLGPGNTDLNEVIRNVQTSLIDKEGATRYKLRSYWVRFGGFTFLKLNPDFKTSDHVHKVKLPEGEDILKFLNNWMTEPYTPKTALWRFLVVDAGYTEYLALKVHHGLGDGLTVLEFINSVTGAQNHPQMQKVFQRPSRGLSILKFVSEVIVLD